MKGRLKRRTVAAALIDVLCGVVFQRASFATEKNEKTENNAVAEARSTELFGDPNFERGFQVVSGGKTLGVLRLPFQAEEITQNTQKEQAPPTWKLATHGSKFDLSKSEITFVSGESTSETTPESTVETRAETPGQTVVRRRTADGEVVLTLGVATDAEYSTPRTADKLWIHLLLQRDFAPEERVSFGDVESLVFSAEARIVDAVRLMSDAEFDPGLHATQASVYFAISNDDPNSPDYRDFIWFGVSFFDDRTEIQPNYVAVDGDPKTIGTGKLIYRIGEQKTIDDVCGGVNPFSKRWTRVELDLTRYVGEMLTAAQERGMLTRTTVDQLNLSHFNFGWETPGTYRSSLEMKNLRLIATKK